MKEEERWGDASRRATRLSVREVPSIVRRPPNLSLDNAARYRGTSGTRDGDSADRSKNTRVPEPGMQVQSLGLAREGSKEKRQRTMVKEYGVLDKTGQVGGSQRKE